MMLCARTISQNPNLVDCFVSLHNIHTLLIGGVCRDYSDVYYYGIACSDCSAVCKNMVTRAKIFWWGVQRILTKIPL